MRWSEGDAPRSRGRKPWALLAYLLLSDRPPSRPRLAELFFSDANDPLGALRWNLAEVRRLLGPKALLEGDPVILTLPPRSFVDALVLVSGSWAEAEGIPTVGGALLEGLDLSSSPAFHPWLLAERRRLQGLASAILREAAHARLAAEDLPGAVRAAARLVELDPLDENHHILFVQALARTGDRQGVARQVAACTDLFRRELGASPTPALFAAAKDTLEEPPPAPRGPAVIRARIEAGEAAIAAGAAGVGWRCLHQAAREASGLGDPLLKVRALVSLGGALIHAIQGRDEEGAAALHEAVFLAEAHGERTLACAAFRELAYVDILRGRHDRARSWLTRAQEKAGDDPAERGRICGLLGMSLCDTGRYRKALDVLETSLADAREADDRRQSARTWVEIGRAHLLRGELSLAAHALDQSLALAQHWTAFRPWPACLRAEVDLREGRTALADEAFQDAFALASELVDPCLEGAAARGLGLVQAARRDVDGALQWLTEARARSSSQCDTYQWMHAYILDSLCDLAVTEGLSPAPDWIQVLEEMAGRCGMRDFSLRSQQYWLRLNPAKTSIAVILMSDEVERPALDAHMRSLPPPYIKGRDRIALDAT